MRKSAEMLWRLFTATGEIKYYLLYKELEQIETEEKTA